MTGKRNPRRIAIVFVGAMICVVVVLVLLSRFVEMNVDQRAYNDTSTAIATINDFVVTDGVITLTAKQWTPIPDAKVATEATP